MEFAGPSARVQLKNILLLTDFSEPSSVALRYAIAIAREYVATVHALHVLIPASLANARTSLSSLAAEAREEVAQVEMQRVASALFGVAHETSIVTDVAIWPGVRRTTEDCHADLIVLGTRGRTGKQKMLLGSVAEEILRLSSVPVFTTGARSRQQVHNAARFHRVFFAADFSPESNSAFPHALSFARESGAHIILLHVIRRQEEATPGPCLSVAGALHQLHELLPPGAESWCRPELLVEYGEPADCILRVAADRHADLIVLGVRDAGGRLSSATQSESKTAHKVVVQSHVPVLTVRS
ncbi:MAG TPA: universal stress protein [Candidatus Acidoferrum sp.]|nr:universal stress protein [Candidatus Acidoferrum sp.]